MKPHTIKYPYERLKFSDGFRGRITLNLEYCIGCGRCVSICPNKAIILVTRDEWDHDYPEIDFGKSSFCGLCVEICPTEALEENEIVELSTTKKEELIYSPEKLSELPTVEEILKDLKRIISVRIKSHKISYVVERKLKK
jgi:formate hydrogenlyase subunit 6/NADH:ubiquinone oxidoreductase subunit I